MKTVCCNGHGQLRLLSCFDNPEDGYAHNVSMCERCGTVYVERVWSNENTTVIFPDGTVVVDVTKDRCEHTFFEYDETPHGDTVLKCSKCGEIHVVK